MKITYYLEVISSWCYWAEPAWAELKQRFAKKVEFDWKIALMPAEAYPQSKAQCDWFYRRSGTIMRAPFMLNSGWFDPEIKQYLVPNLVAQAAKDLGVTDDRIGTSDLSQHPNRDLTGESAFFFRVNILR